jgi:hypothetical protein
MEQAFMPAKRSLKDWALAPEVKAFLRHNINFFSGAIHELEVE